MQGLTVFGDILKFFQRQNNWLGWLYFTLLYCVNVALFLPGIVLILGAGFIFGCLFSTWDAQFPLSKADSGLIKRLVHCLHASLFENLSARCVLPWE